MPDKAKAEHPPLPPAPRKHVGKTGPNLFVKGGPERASVQDLAYATEGPLTDEKDVARQIDKAYARDPTDPYRGNKRIKLRGKRTKR